MKVAVSGSSGLIGSALTAELRRAGHEVLRLVRAADAPAPDTAWWNPVTGMLDRQKVEALDAVVHLAGESLAGRWTPEKMTRIHESRVLGTRQLVQALAGLSRPPRIIVAASAVGYYGNRDNEPLTETAAPGTGFLAEICVEWEEATALATAAGIRVVRPRFGMVLSPAGGALAALLPVFRAGLGGRIGNGRQFLSWIALPDAVAAIQFALGNNELSGPVNAVAPHPVTNRVFTRALACRLHRPALWPLPAFMARAVFGRMADELLLSSARVIPARLTQSGFQFTLPEIGAALKSLLA